MIQKRLKNKEEEEIDELDNTKEKKGVNSRKIKGLKIIIQPLRYFCC